MGETSAPTDFDPGGLDARPDGHVSGATSAPIDFDPLELADGFFASVRDPYPTLAQLRREDPVLVGPLPFGEHGLEPAVQQSVHFRDVTVLGFEEANQVLLDHKAFSSRIYSAIMGSVMGRTILELDEPAHRLNRLLVAPAFQSKVLRRWDTELITPVVDDLIDAFAPSGRADLVRSFTFQFPVRVIARILGLPAEDYPRFQRWSIELIGVVFDHERGMAASRALSDYFAEILEERRLRPGDDLITDLSRAEIEGERLSDQEIFSFLRLLLPAGVETTYRATGNFLFELLSHPEQLELVRTRPELVPRGFEEALRVEPPIMLVVREAVAPTRIGGQAGVQVEPGAHVAICVGSANHDERRWDRPEEFDVMREPKRHLTFGHGVHACLGMHLARLEARIAVERLLGRLPSLRLDREVTGKDGNANDRQNPDPCITGFAFRSPNALPVRYD